MREAAALVGRRLLCWWQLVARGGSRRQSAAGHPLRASRPVFLNVTHRSTLWACSSGIGGLGAAAVPPARKSGKLHSGRIPQAGTTEPAHWRVIEFSEALKSPPGGAGGGDGLADTTRPPQKRKSFRNEKRATSPLCGNGWPLGCVVDGVEAVDTPPYSRAGEGCGRPVGKVPFYPASPRGRFWKAYRLLCFPVQSCCFFAWAMLGYESIFLERARLIL